MFCKVHLEALDPIYLSQAKHVLYVKKVYFTNA